MKAWIQHNCEYVLAEMEGDEEVCNMLGVLWQVVFETMVPQSIAGWYRDSGYHI